MVNISNHLASAKWGPHQLEQAKLWGKDIVIDIPFPNVPPYADETEIFRLAEKLKKDIQATGDTAIHIMGEMGLTFVLVYLLMIDGRYEVLHSTTERKTVENPDGTKTQSFEFVRFRPYF